MPGTAYNSIQNPRVYGALRRRGLSKRSAAKISNAQASAKASAATGLAIPPHGPDALFNQPGVGGVRWSRRRKRLKAFNWGAHGGQTISGALGRGADGRFANSGSPSTSQRGSDAQRQRRAEMRAKRQARADERMAAHAAEATQEETTRGEEDAYIAGGVTGRERQQRRAEIATKRRERAAARLAAHRQEAAAERETRRQEDAAEAAARATEAAAGGDKKGGGGGGGGKQKPGDDEKRATDEKKKAELRTRTAPQAGLSAAEAEALAAVAGGSGAGTAGTGRLRAMGLMDDTGATAAGRRLLSALERGDVRGALAAIQDGKARLARDAAKRAAQQKRDADRAKRERERAAAAKKPAPKPAPGPAAGSERSQTLAAQIIRNLSERRQRRRHKQDDQEKAMFANMGGGSGGGGGGGGKGGGGGSKLWPKGPSGKRTPQAAAAEARSGGGSGGANGPSQAVVERARDLAKRDQDLYDKMTALRKQHDALDPSWGQKLKPKHQKERETQQAAIQKQIDALKKQRDGVLRDQETNTRELHASQKTARNAPAFTVFKDRAGHDRWAAITTTAYEDKDQEWISCKAIRQVVRAGDASGQRGPLRYWHVPGLDLGDCDFQAALDGGRLLLESGTFRSPAAARIGLKAAEKGYQMSPGFLHTRHEPRGGVFDHIAIFERSFVPPGRASNPYTRLFTKESRMLTDAKRKEITDLVEGDEEARGWLAQSLGIAGAMLKAADDAGAVYKDAPTWAQDLAQRLGALEAAYKAPMPPEAMIEAGDTEAADGTEELDADLGMGDAPDGDEGDVSDALDDEGFADMLVQKLLAALAPVLDIEKKIAGHADAIKGGVGQMMGQYTAKKDDEAAQLRTQVADLQMRLKALEGEQPRARASMAGSVWGDLTGMVVTKEQAAALGAVLGDGAPPPGLNAAEAGAYELIFGNS